MFKHIKEVSNRAKPSLGFVGDSKQKLEAERNRLNSFISRRDADHQKSHDLTERWQLACQQEKTNLWIKQKQGLVSVNATKAVDQLIEQAEYRVEHYKNATMAINQEIQQAQSYRSHLDTLLARLNHEEFREHFHSNTKNLMLDAPVVAALDSLPAAELKAISREISTLGHTIDALMELEAGK